MSSTIQPAATTVAGFPCLHGAPTPGRDGAPAIVLLHGAFADETTFEGWVPRLADAGYDTYAPARRGRNGFGPEKARALTLDDYLDDRRGLLDALGGGRPPVVIGHSLGGLLAQKLAEEGRTSAIVLLASAPPSMLTAQTVALPRFAPQLPKIMTGKPFIVGNDACSVLALNKVPETDRPAIHAHLTHESGKVYRSMMFGTVRVDADKVHVPVFVGGGTDDRIVSARLVRKTAKHYGVDAHLYDGHGHWLVGEPGWEALVDELVTWISANVLRTAPTA